LSTSEEITREIRAQARELLESGQVSCIIGYEVGSRGRARPAFVHDADDVERLIWGPDCVHNLTVYLHDFKKPRYQRSVGRAAD